MNAILILLVLVGFFALKQKTEPTRNILLVVLTLLCFCMFSVEGLYGANALPEIVDSGFLIPNQTANDNAFDNTDVTTRWGSDFDDKAVTEVVVAGLDDGVHVENATNLVTGWQTDIPIGSFSPANLLKKLRSSKRLRVNGSEQSAKPTGTGPMVQTKNFWLANDVYSISFDENWWLRGPTGIQCNGIVQLKPELPSNIITVNQHGDNTLEDTRTPYNINDIFTCEPGIQIGGQRSASDPDMHGAIPIDFYFKEPPTNVGQGGQGGNFSPGSGGGTGFAIGGAAGTYDGLPYAIRDEGGINAPPITVFGSKNRYIISGSSNINLDGISPILDINCKVGKEKQPDATQNEVGIFEETKVDYNSKGQRFLRTNYFASGSVSNDINGDIDKILTCTIPCDSPRPPGGCPTDWLVIDDTATTWYEPSTTDAPFIDPTAPYNKSFDLNFKETCCRKCEENDYCPLAYCPTGSGNTTCPSGIFKSPQSSSDNITYYGRVGGDNYKERCCLKVTACPSTPSAAEKDLCTLGGKVYKESILDETYKGELGDPGPGGFIDSCCRVASCQSGQQSCSQWGWWSDITGRIDGPKCKNGFFDTYCQEEEIAGVLASVMNDRTDSSA